MSLWIEVGRAAERHEHHSNAEAWEREDDPIQGQLGRLPCQGAMAAQGSSFLSASSPKRSERDLGTDREKIAHQ